MNWNRKDIDSIPVSGGIIKTGDDRIERYSEDTMMRGHPDAVIVARDETEVSEVLAYCNAKRIPVTFCGSQTSMTGASVPDEGLLISTEKLDGIIDISSKEGVAEATVRPGTVVADFQRAISEAGFFYPVAPTSRDECRIGSNVCTNATGEDSYKYGPIRCYVGRFELILADGSKKTLERKPDEAPSPERNKAGYFTDWENPIDLIIGSEGTLGFVSKVTLRLLPPASTFFSLLIPFPSNQKALEFAAEIILNKAGGVEPRALELIDSGALAHMRTAEGLPQISDKTKSFLYIKQEYPDDEKRDFWLGKWYEAASPFAGQDLIDSIIVALTPKQQEDFRLWRHRIPESANELGRSYWTNGGGKVGSDWWVPAGRLLTMMDFFYSVADSTGLPYMGYAHIGNGHPHTNILTRNPEEKRRALGALTTCCRKAVELGGGVAGEHGIGKLHRDLVQIQHTKEVINKMRSWKQEYDPNWILGRGNILTHSLVTGG